MVQMMIQAAGGSRVQKRYNEITLEKVGTQPLSRRYPYPYGFIIGTRAEDGDCVDCYLITHDPVAAGTIVECEPVGLLLQDEGGEIDHKILAVLPGQEAKLGTALLKELQDFINTIFARHPEIEVRVGPILSRQAALNHLRNARVERSLEFDPGYVDIKNHR